ncbi:MAG: YceI family protein [Sphingomonadaceae bacterium]|nr:YceI family protein [Sphingomonadaceae bacterium]
MYQSHHSLRLITAASLLALGACSQPAPAPLVEGSWTLDSTASDLSFVTVKAGNVGEAHGFKGLSGSVTPEGLATLAVDLATVDTGVDIRDERMRDVLFEVGTHPQAKVSAQLDPASLSALAVGESKTMPVKATLDLHGTSSEIETQLDVVRTGADTVLVITTRPIILDATAFGLGEGVEKLRNLAQLPAISTAVPVTFRLTYSR